MYFLRFYVRWFVYGTFYLLNFLFFIFVGINYGFLMRYEYWLTHGCLSASFRKYTTICTSYALELYLIIFFGLIFNCKGCEIFQVQHLLREVLRLDRFFRELFKVIQFIRIKRNFFRHTMFLEFPSFSMVIVSVGVSDNSTIG